jgi:hypothetical protein
MDVIWWVTAVAGAIGINLIASELFAWGPRFSEYVMRRAVRRLAPEMQDRMQEEWTGHLQTIPPGLWRIVAAAGFYLATREINVALRVRERQEKQTSGEHIVPAGLSNALVPAGLSNAIYLSAYQNRHAGDIKEGKQGRVLVLHLHDEPHPPSKPTPPKR